MLVYSFGFIVSKRSCGDEMGALVSNSDVECMPREMIL